MIAIPYFNHTVGSSSCKHCPWRIKLQTRPLFPRMRFYELMQHLSRLCLYPTIAEALRIITKIFNCWLIYSWLRPWNKSNSSWSRHFLQADRFLLLFHHLFSRFLERLRGRFFDLTDQLFLQAECLVLHGLNFINFFDFFFSFLCLAALHYKRWFSQESHFQDFIDLF